MADESSFANQFLGALPTGVAIHVAGRVVYTNPALVRMVGAPSAGDCLGRSILDFIHPDYQERTLDRVRGVYEQKGPADWVEVEFRRTDGTPFPVEVAASAVDWNGQPAAQVLVVDVTRRKEAERARHESELRYERLIEGLPLGVVIHAEGKVVYANREAVRIVGGGDPADYLGRSVLGFVHPDHVELSRARIQRLYDRQGNVPVQAMHLVRRDGVVVEVELAGAMVDWEGRPAGQVVLVDVTERRRLERRIQQAQKNESMEVLAGGVAHDFNNLLVSILGSTDLALLELPDGAAARAHVERIAVGARRAAGLARQMLAYAGRGGIHFEQIDLGGLVRETAGLLEASLSRKAVLHYEIPSDIPSVEGDATQLRQVVLNLIANARDAIGDREGAIAVSVGAVDADREALHSPYLTEERPPGRYVFVDVADTGVGMAGKVLARLFDPFFTTKFAGRGLGLAAVLGIVRAHHGVVRVESRPGAGARFRVLLPALPADGRAPAPRQDDRGVVAPSAPGGTILVVDDDESVRVITGHMLRRSGYSVIEAEDGESALAVFRAQGDAIDCVILDQVMPRMDGRETFHALVGLREDVRVVICSGFGERDSSWEPADRERLVFLQKPFERDELLAAVGRALSPVSRRRPDPSSA